MYWKCINDIFGYCKTEPDGADKAYTEDRATKINGVDTIVKISLGMGATCSLNPKTCRKHLTWEKVCPEDTAPVNTAIKTTIVPNKKTKKDKGKQQELI